MILVKEDSAIKHSFWKKIAAVTRSRCLFYCFSRYEKMQKIGLIKTSPENKYLKAYSASFFQSTEGLIPDLCPELSGWVEGQRLQWLVISSLQRQVTSDSF